MSDLARSGRAGEAERAPGPSATSLGASDWLSYAATPCFALAALLAGLHEHGPVAILCSAAHGSSLFGGMAPMYLLMSAFHAAPWVTLIARRGLPQRADAFTPRPPPRPKRG